MLKTLDDLLALEALCVHCQCVTRWPFFCADRYIEDYFIQGEPTQREKDIMDKCCFSLDTKEQYVKHLTDTGFSHIQVGSVTESVMEGVTYKWVGCWSFKYRQHLRSYQDGYRLNCDSAQSWQLYSATPLRNQATWTIIRYPTQLHYFDPELTNRCTFLSTRLGSDR